MLAGISCSHPHPHACSNGEIRRGRQGQTMGLIAVTRRAVRRRRARTVVQLRLVKRLLLPTGSVGPTPTATLCGVAAVPSLARLAARRRSIGESCRHVDAGEQNLAVGIKRNRAFDLPQRACTYVLYYVHPVAVTQAPANSPCEGGAVQGGTDR